MRPVKAFGFKGIRKPGKNNRSLRFGGIGNRFRDHGLIHNIRVIRISFCKCDISPVLYAVPGAGYLMAVDVGAAAALIAGFSRIFADKGDIFLFGKRKKIVFILQKDNGFFSDLFRHFMIPVSVKYRCFIPVFLKTVYNVQDTLHSPVQHRFIQAAVLYRIHDQLVIDAAGGGHFQIQAGFQIGYSVVHRAPVTYHKTIKAPFPSQDIGERFFMLCRIGAVDFVVGAHNGPGLLFAYRPFKGRHIDLAQRPFVNLGG